MSNTNRIEWVDVLKGVSIIWLIVYHFYVFSWMRSPVPVFFFLSGLFFSEGKSFMLFVGKKAKALLIPFVFFFVLGIAASALKSFLQGDSYSFPPLWLFATLIPADADNGSPLGVGAIWFLISLFEIYIIYYVLRLVSQNRCWLLIAGLVLFFLSCSLLQRYAIGALFYIFYTFGYCIFFIVAHLMRDKILYGRIPVWILIIAVILYSIRYIDVPNINYLDVQMGGGMIKWMVSMSGLVILLIYICKKISSIGMLSELKSYRFLLFEGRNSLTILGIHLLVMSVASILLKHFISGGILYHAVLLTIVLIVCNICILLFNRYLPFLVNHKRDC